MWGQVIAACLALVGVLATTNLLVGAQTRVRHQLSDEFKLLDEMPEKLAARPVFEEYVSESLQVYVDRQRQRRLTLEQLRTRRNVGRFVYFGAPIVGVLVAVDLLWQDRLDALLVVLWIAAGVSAVQVAVTLWTFRLMDQIALRHIQIEREAQALET